MKPDPDPRKTAGEALSQPRIGRYYEDFAEGEVYQHPLGRTITDADNTWFTLLTMNTNPNHFDVHYARQSEFGMPLVNSCLTLSIVLGLSVVDTSQLAFANLGWTDITIPNPVFVGDTIYSESLVLHKRESRSRDFAGIVGVMTRGLNQKGETVMTFRRSFYVYKRGADRAESSFPGAADSITDYLHAHEEDDVTG